MPKEVINEPGAAHPFCSLCSPFGGSALGNPSSRLPTMLALAPRAQSSLTAYNLGEVIQISSNRSFFTVNHGTEVSDFPCVDVKSVSGPVQIESKYTESWDGLNHL